jgi:hypothetical protein
LEATHLTGILLIPAMLLFRERARRRGLTSDPAGWFRLGCLSAAGIAGLTLVAVGAHFAFEEHSVLKDYFKWMHSGEQSYFSTVQVELFRRAGILVGLGFPCAIVLVKREWALLGAWWATLALYAVMIAISKVEYQGGYNIAAIPVFAVGIGAALQIAWDRSKKPWPTVVGVIGLALVVWQGVDGYGQVRRPMASDSARERAESIRQVASTSDAVILDVRPKDVEFDLTQLPNLTRLYLGGDAPNVALLDEKNASGVPYLTEAAGDAYAKRIEASIDKALADGHRAFVFESVWTPEASRPRLQRLANGLAQRFAAKGPTRQSGFVELERRGG